MGVQQSSPRKTNTKASNNAINTIYAMFEQSNTVVLAALKERNPRMSKPQIQNIQNVVEQLLEPFKVNEKYNWGNQIYVKFRKHFTNNFEPLWVASREQFYELLLSNCKIKAKEMMPHGKEEITYQELFYSIASEELEHKMVDTFTGDIPEDLLKKNALKWSIVDEFDRELQANINEERKQKLRDYINERRVEEVSLILPQTLFIKKMSAASQEQVFDLLKFYRQFTYTLQQIFCSNNLISCPIKNFIVSLEEKIGKKKIKTETYKKSELLGMSEQIRKVRKIRQTNNNIILFQMRAFLEAYNQFVWMFLELHYMEDSNLGKIIQSEVLFAIIFKNLWTFFQWIADRGFQYEEAELEHYFGKKVNGGSLKLTEDKMERYIILLDGLRGEKHPQRYLKKLVIFYREVSKECENADQLLSVYEVVMQEAVLRKGLRDLRLFRMRNIIDKILKIEQSSLNGGEITYSWTTWCILIQLLKQKVNYKYGGLMISTKSLPQRNSDYDWENVRINEDCDGKEYKSEFKREVEIQIPQKSRVALRASEK